MEKNTCFFAGHKRLPPDRIEHILKHLDDEVENLIRQGVTEFISGGASGFDLIAASLVLTKKELGRDVRLIFALPCRNQEKFRPEEQAYLYKKLLGEADEIRYVSDEYGDDCVKKRNQYMVDRAGYCICCLMRREGDTFRTVDYARKAGIEVINVAT